MKLKSVFKKETKKSVKLSCADAMNKMKLDKILGGGGGTTPPPDTDAIKLNSSRSNAY